MKTAHFSDGRLLFPFLEGEMIDEVRAHRWWHGFEGVLFVVLGVFALLLPQLTALVTTVMISALLFGGGVMRLINSARFRYNRWWRLLSGSLMAIVGAMMFLEPASGFAALMLAVCALLITEGIVEIFMAFAFRPLHRWGWILASGILALALGILLFSGNLATSMIFVAFIIGLNFITYGLAMTLMALDIDRIS